MAEETRERPAIHVCLAGPSEPGLYRWVEVGAEEEGLPTRHVALPIDDAVAAAFAAAQGSRFGIGVGIGQGRVVLHEAHMPPEQPVLSFDLAAGGPRACRLMGGNAARLVVRLPLRLADELAPAPQEERRHSPGPSEAPLASVRGPGAGGVTVETADAAQIARVTLIVARLLRERGIL